MTLEEHPKVRAARDQVHRLQSELGAAQERVEAADAEVKAADHAVEAAFVAGRGVQQARARAEAAAVALSRARADVTALERVLEEAKRAVPVAVAAARQELRGALDRDYRAAVLALGEALAAAVRCNHQVLQLTGQYAAAGLEMPYQAGLAELASTDRLPAGSPMHEESPVWNYRRENVETLYRAWVRWTRAAGFPVAAVEPVRVTALLPRRPVPRDMAGLVADGGWRGYLNALRMRADVLERKLESLPYGQRTR
jgi:hypothetical protein